jgi:hypothetical protein
MNCPNCGKEMYDNRQKKASGEYKATYPDFTCKDKTCIDPLTEKRSAVYLPKDTIPPKAKDERIKAEVRQGDETAGASYVMRYAVDLVIAYKDTPEKIPAAFEQAKKGFLVLYPVFKFPLPKTE